MLSHARRTLLITGAAGRIGSAVARAAHGAGWSLILSDIQSERLHALIPTLEGSTQNQGSPFLFACDTTSVASMQSLIAAVEERSSHVDAAVHCAYPRSAGWGAPLEGLNAEHLSQDLGMQLGGAILFSQLMIGHFKKHGGGHLIHLSSIQGISAPKFEHYAGTGMTSPVEYAAIKAGVIAITRWLAKNNANCNIRVNCVSPGGIADGQPEEFVRRYRESCTNHGMLSADQVAAAILFLLDPVSCAINGHNLVVDDGWSL